MSYALTPQASWCPLVSDDGVSFPGPSSRRTPGPRVDDLGAHGKGQPRAALDPSLRWDDGVGCTQIKPCIPNPALYGEGRAQIAHRIPTPTPSSRRTPGPRVDDLRAHGKGQPHAALDPSLRWDDGEGCAQIKPSMPNPALYGEGRTPITYRTPTPTPSSRRTPGPSVTEQ